MTQLHWLCARKRCCLYHQGRQPHGWQAPQNCLDSLLFRAAHYITHHQKLLRHAATGCCRVGSCLLLLLLHQAKVHQAPDHYALGGHHSAEVGAAAGGMRPTEPGSRDGGVQDQHGYIAIRLRWGLALLYLAAKL